MISLYVTMIKQQNNSWSTRILSFLFQFVVTVCGLNHYIVLSVLTANRISWTIPSYTKWRIIHDGVQTDQVAIISNYILKISLSIGTTYREFFFVVVVLDGCLLCVCVRCLYFDLGGDWMDSIWSRQSTPIEHTVCVSLQCSVFHIYTRSIPRALYC